jgi:hypothetical protein
MWRPVRATPNSGMMGMNYLLAFDKPVGHAWHYRGWDKTTGRLWRLGLRSDDTRRLPARLAAHARGRGGRLTAVARARGIGWTLVWFEEGDRNRERQRKNCGRYARDDCMLCNTGRPHGKDTTDADT